MGSRWTALLLAPLLAGCPTHPTIGGRFWVEAGAWRPSASSDSTPGYGGPSGPDGAGPGGTLAVGATVDPRIQGSDVLGLLGWQVGSMATKSGRRAGDDREETKYWNADILLSAGLAWRPVEEDRTLLSGEFLLGFSASALSLRGTDGAGAPAGVRFDMDERIVGGRVRAGPWRGFEFLLEDVEGSIQENSGGPYDVESDGQGGWSRRWRAGVAFPLGKDTLLEACWRSLSLRVENGSDHARFRAEGPWIGVLFRF